jgi:hypothetical protein
MMTSYTRLFTAFALGLGTLAFVGCDDHDTNPPPANPNAGPAERVGEKIDRNAEKAGESIQRGADKAEDKLDRAADKTRDALDRTGDRLDRAADELKTPATRPATRPVGE